MGTCTSRLLRPQFPHLYIGHDGTCPDSLADVLGGRDERINKTALRKAQSAPLTCQGT